MDKREGTRDKDGLKVRTPRSKSLPRWFVGRSFKNKNDSIGLSSREQTLFLRTNHGSGWRFTSSLRCTLRELPTSLTSTYKNRCPSWAIGFRPTRGRVINDYKASSKVLTTLYTEES